ncbi:MAG: hypothetical protein HN413_14525 [Chloroflexi bacterium]|jgi:hypothetical protein|nr:hypothetical protein [Chloroflexota bacterium]
MKAYGKAKVSDFLGDAIVYRNLQPLDARLPSLGDLHETVGLPAGVVPRKSTNDYARVVAQILRAGRALDAPQTPIRRVIFLGDTRLNDGTAFANICAAGGWPGLAFIAAEKPDQAPSFEMEQRGANAHVYIANRWAALPDFAAYCAAQNFPVDESTAVLVDLDKTTLGARGRNDCVIDQVRVDAAFQTVSVLLGDDFDAPAFEASYRELNKVEYHPFTTDNQDYLVYLCLILGSGIFSLEGLIDDIRSGRVASFERFLTEVSARATELSAALQGIHHDVQTRVAAGDPTPFKTFRRNEYRATAARMGQLGTESTVEQKLAEEIVITREVYTQALTWLNQGAFIFGLSDKPDEASLPEAEQASQGAQPIHRIETDVVGE